MALDVSLRASFEPKFPLNRLEVLETTLKEATPAIVDRRRLNLYYGGTLSRKTSEISITGRWANSKKPRKGIRRRK